MGAGEWLDEFWGVDVEGMMALLLVGVEGICNRVMWEVGLCVVYRLGNDGREESNCCMVRLLMDFGPALTYKLSSSLNS